VECHVCVVIAREVRLSVVVETDNVAVNLSQQLIGHTIPEFNRTTRLCGRRFGTTFL